MQQLYVAAPLQSYFRRTRLAPISHKPGMMMLVVVPLSPAIFAKNQTPVFKKGREMKETYLPIQYERINDN